MENQIQEKKITCPHCGSSNCFQEDHEIQDKIVESFLCMGCGYTTTSVNTTDSEFIKQFEDTCPQLFKDIKFTDPKTGYIWYPTVLNFPEHGLVFPDGADAFDWKWRAMPIVPVSEDEKEKYPIPGEEGKFYESRVDVDSSKLFERNQFQDACKFLNIIQTVEQ